MSTEAIRIAEAAAIFFAAMSAAFTLLISALLVWQLRRSRQLLVKPTIIVAIVLNVTLQWPAAFESVRIYARLDHPWTYFFLVQVFGLLLTTMALWTHRDVASDVAARLRATPWEQLRWPRRIWGPLALFSASYVAIYLAVVPFSSTGIYAVLTAPGEAAAAREASLKLLTNPFLTYGYFFNAKVLLIVLAVVAVVNLRGAVTQPLRFVATTAVLAALAFASALSGGRAFAVWIIMSALLIPFAKRGFRVRPRLVILPLVALLLIPAALTLLREGNDITPTTLVTSSYDTIIRDRILGSGVETGWAYLDYAEKNGLLGPEGWPRLAPLAGVEPVNLPNIISRNYFPSSLAFDSGLANANFMFAYYLYFGFWSIPLSLLLLMLLDLPLYFTQRMNGGLLLAFVVMGIVNAVSLAEAEITTAFVTHGALLGPVFLIAYSRCFQSRAFPTRTSRPSAPLPRDRARLE